MTTARSPMAEAMARQGISFRRLAFKVDCDPGYLCRVARGLRRPSKEIAERIADALGIAPQRVRDLRPKQ